MCRVRVKNRVRVRMVYYYISLYGYGAVSSINAVEGYGQNS